MIGKGLRLSILKMRLNGFDFLTSAPQNFIFQRKSNKTNFGAKMYKYRTIKS